MKCLPRKIPINCCNYRIKKEPNGWCSIFPQALLQIRGIVVWGKIRISRWKWGFFLLTSKGSFLQLRDLHFRRLEVCGKPSQLLFARIHVLSSSLCTQRQTYHTQERQMHHPSTATPRCSEHRPLSAQMQLGVLLWQKQSSEMEEFYLTSKGSSL